MVRRKSQSCHRLLALHCCPATQKHYCLDAHTLLFLFLFIFFSFFAYWGLPTVERTMATGRTSQSMFLLLWPFQAALLISFALMALVTLFHLYQDIRALFGKNVFEWAPAEIHTDI